MRELKNVASLVKKVLNTSNTGEVEQLIDDYSK
jgi:hypothetical protein